MSSDREGQMSERCISPNQIEPQHSLIFKTNSPLEGEHLSTEHFLKDMYNCSKHSSEISIRDEELLSSQNMDTASKAVECCDNIPTEQQLQITSLTEQQSCESETLCTPVHCANDITVDKIQDAQFFEISNEVHKNTLDETLSNSCRNDMEIHTSHYNATDNIDFPSVKSKEHESDTYNLPEDTRLNQDTTRQWMKSPHKVNWTVQPRLSHYCSSEFQKEGNYLKGCKWSPDGSCLITNSNDQNLRLFNLPSDIHTHSTYSQDDGMYMDHTFTEIVSDLSIYVPALIYDYCWLPVNASAHSSTRCIACTSRDSPVHMYDTYTGELRGSYRAYNHLDELVAAHSLCFFPDASKLLCGFNKHIRIFDVSTPGRQFTEKKTFCKEGQSGIISCLAVNPSLNATYAAGSYSRQVAVYSMSHNEMIYMFEAQEGGITHIQFSPDGNRLYCGGRKDPEIICWDLRNPGHILFSAIRDVQTNQRIYFQVDDTGDWLMSGNHNGTVTVWNTTSQPQSQYGYLDSILPSCLTFRAHYDTVNGLSFHPTLPLIATASGQRHFYSPTTCQQITSDTSSDEDDTDLPVGDNSLKFWLFPRL